MKNYRQHLVLAEQKSQEAYDKTILSLSGGALGISFAFVNEFVDTNNVINPCALKWAWILWVASMLFVLISFFTSQLALRKTIAQVDSGTIDNSKLGGIFDIITLIANILAGSALIYGMFLMISFVNSNWKG